MFAMSFTGSGSLSNGVIAGIIGGIIVITLVIIILVVSMACFYCRKGKQYWILTSDMLLFIAYIK